MRAKVSILLSGLVCVACSAGASKDGPSPAPGGDGGFVFDSGTPVGADGGLHVDGATPSPDTALDPDAACASEVQKGSRTPLDIVVLLDQSGSMKESSKWTSVTTALASFVDDSASSGIGVGLQYFSIPVKGTDPAVEACLSSCRDCACAASCGCTGGCSVVTSGGVTKVSCAPGGMSCSVSDYAAVEVPIAPLPGVASAIKASMSKHAPSGGTPTRPALEGVISYARSFQAANPDHRVVIVLATDGVPSTGECSPNTVADVESVASGAKKATPSISTFVIGVGKDLTALNGIAAAGGTTSAYLVDTSSGAVKSFTDALNAIRASSLACEYLIPVPKDGSKIDFSKVNVEFTKGDGSKLTLLQVPDAAHCDPATGGWFYDKSTAPTRIEICPASCDLFAKEAAGAVLQILLGCQTLVAPPR